MNQFSLIFKNEEYKLPKKKKIICAVAEKVADQLLENNKYIVSSNVRSEIFQSFIKYWLDEKEMPDIQLSNFNEYEALSQEFEMMTDIIDKTKDSPLFKIECLINNSCSDKSSIENDISKQLDYYLDNFPEKIYKIPINSLYNIFNNENKVLKSYLKAYLFITKKLIQNDTSDPDINLYTLIQTIDGSQLFDESHEMFFDLISRYNEFGFFPQCSPTFIQEQFERKNKLRQNELNDLFLNGKYNELRKLICDENVTFLEIPNGVTEIANCAFFDCTSLKEVIIPSSVKKIGCYAFFRCTSLKSIFVPSSVQAIGKCAFSCCMSLKKFRIPSSIKVIDSFVFDGCSSLEEVVIPEGVTAICLCAFSYCTNLRKVVIPTTVANISGWVFNDCPSLVEINLPPNLDKIEGGLFYNCKKLETVNIPPKIQSIGAKAFQNCSSLKKVEIPSHLVSIEDDTFSGCSSLTEINLPQKLQNIGCNAFWNCSKLKNIEIPPDVKTMGVGAFQSCSSITSVKIPVGVDWVRSFTFENCSELQHVEFQTNVRAQNICPFVFHNCPKLKEVVIALSNDSNFRCNSFDLNTKIKINKVFT
ncbi:hypothetical protein M9Y10_033175 [Tritrichomonas musculus]|uniref:Uncharacterized protein n=2 Tax=Tritrichomonas musculus TaxID=1915356 RepID=A0ABR2GY12_9EUKA